MNAPDTPFAFDSAIAAAADKIEPKVVAWRRDIHANPELGNREFRTSKLLAEHLRSLPGIEVHEKIAHTGVLGILKGGKPGPVVALRADIDALPVEEQVDVPFRSKVKTEWNGAMCGVMHACGHDAHTAILMGVAEILSGMRDRIPGTVKFIFQPAEEGAPEGEEGGAQLMIKERALKNPDVAAIFGLHVTSNIHTGKIGYRSGPMMASSDTWKVFLRGTQTHGAMPWRGIDPIVIGAQVVLGLQTIVSRRLDITKEPSVVTVGAFHGGNRDNIIPDEVSMLGTIRAFDEEQRNEIHAHVKHITEMIAAAGGAKARVEIKRGYDVTVNHPGLTEWAIPTIARIAGEENVGVIDKVCGAEDFSFFQKEIPGLFWRLGCTPPQTAIRDSAPGHSPRFYLDETCLKLGVKVQCALVLDWLAANSLNPVLFDLDGTLTDPREGITRSIAYALERMGLVPPPLDELTFAIGPPLRRSLATLLADESPAAVERALAFYRERFADVGLFENAVYDGIAETLHALVERGAVLYVATSKPRVYAERIVRHFELDTHFEAIHGCELDGTREDKRDLLAHLLPHHGVAPQAAAMIGDRGADMIAARHHGLRAVGALWGYGSRGELLDGGADSLCASPRDLHALLAPS